MVEGVLPINPCLNCGACCALYRVSFYWAEADDSDAGGVPVMLTEDVTPFVRCMKGTNSSHPRCAALLGEVGQSVACTIYDHRSSTCREFGLHWNEGAVYYEPTDLIRCAQARASFGLEPLAIAARAYETDGAVQRGA